MGLVLEKNDLLKKHQPIQEDLVNVINLQKFDRKANLSLSGYKFIDLFAGIGGIRTRFDELEAQCVFSSEWDKYAQCKGTLDITVTGYEGIRWDKVG